MSVENWPNCIALTLGNEGGFQKLYGDRGNWTGGRVGFGDLVGTNWGISAASHPGVDIVNLTRDGAIAIYRAEYWGAIHGDTLPVGVDAAAFDDAVNSGPGAAIKRLQAAVGAVADGSFGPVTAAAIARADPKTVITIMCDDRLATYHRDPAWTQFGKVWTGRIAHVRDAALKMVTTPPVALPPAFLQRPPLIAPILAAPAKVAPPAAVSGPSVVSSAGGLGPLFAMISQVVASIITAMKGARK